MSENPLSPSEENPSSVSANDSARQKTAKVYRFTDKSFTMTLFLTAAGLLGLYLIINHGSSNPINELIKKTQPQIAKTQPQKKNAKPGAKAKKSPAKKAAALSPAEIARRAKIIIPRVKISGTGLPFSRPADFTIADIRHMIAHHKKTNIAELWRSPANLSFKVWLGHDAKFLYVKTEVTDDIHVQKTPNQMWFNDCLQIALLPGDSKWSKQWEMNFALVNGRMPLAMISLAPNHLLKNRAVLQKQFGKIHRSNGITTYDLKLPLAELGLTQAQLQKGIRFNAAVNDTDDNKPRLFWAEIAEGICFHKDPFAYPWVIFEK